MAHDVELADRIRELLVGEPVQTTKAMFGGLAFMVGGHMAVVVSGRGPLMVRVGPDDLDALLGEPQTEPMVMQGREVKGWLQVAAEGLESDDDLARWVEIGVATTRALPSRRV